MRRGRPALGVPRRSGPDPHGSPAVDGAAAAHTYGAPGDYTATLSATDKDGGEASDAAAAHVVRSHTAVALEDASGLAVGTATLAARLSDADDAATAKLADHELVVEVAATTYRAQTDADGIARVTLASPLAPGSYPVSVRFDGDALYLPSQATGTLTVLGATPGHVTGGGLRSSANGRGGFNVHSDGEKVWGELQYQSATAGYFHASTMTSLVIARDGRSAWFSGVGKDGRTFVAYVEDNGEPGTRDVWRMWIDGRLETDGPLRGGNIQIHQGSSGAAALRQMGSDAMRSWYNISSGLVSARRAGETLLRYTWRASVSAA